MYGVPGHTHILKVDKYSMPAGAELVSISNRNAGDGGSRFIDLKFGEMQKADFAISDCTVAIASEITKRKKSLSTNPQELARAVKDQFAVETAERSSAEVKAMSASGFVGGAGTATPASEAAAQQPARIQPASFSAAAKVPAADANAELTKMDNALGFVDLHDHDVLPFTQTAVRVKGTLGNNFKVSVNGTELSAKQVGTKTTVKDKQLEIWGFIGVNLLPGKNILQVSQVDPWGNDRGKEQIEVIAPSKLGKLKIETSKNTYPADGKTLVKVVVKLADASDVPVTVRIPITLETTNGVWLVKDLDPVEPGTQVFIEGGRAEFEMVPPIEPGSSMIRVSSSGVTSQTRIEFVPELRPMMAAGIVEYQVNLGSLAHNAIQPSLNDGFENQLKLFSTQNADGSATSGGHAALLLKGKIKGDNLLTLAYDSDKTSGERLFRDIQPDQYYPVYGDSSVRGYDAQATSKAYIRLDHGRTYLLYGDYLTSEPGTGNSLSNYSRSMTGVKEHFENGRVSATGFASHDSLRQVVEELFANGTSGPFTLANNNGIENSEKVEVLVRDRNQLFAVTAGIKLQDKTGFTAEFAGTQHEATGTGMGYRFEFLHDGDKLKTKAYFTRTDAAFDNPTSIMNKGRGESGIKTSYAINKTTRLVGEFIRTEDVTNAGTQQGGQLVMEKSLPGNIQTSFGFRHAEETAAPANTGSVGVTPNSINTLVSKISFQVPHFNRATGTFDYEQDIADSSKRVLAAGGTYRLWSKGKVYFRQELISSLGDVYSLNSLQRRNTTQFGIDTAYFKDAHVFSEYRIRDLSNGREAEAAIGLRNNWHLAKGLVANTGVESIRTLNGVSANSVALTGGVDYTAHEDWKASARMEWRGSTTSTNILNTVGFAARLNDSWTFLGRNVLASTKTKSTSGTPGGTHLQDRLQFGFALRDSARNRWNALSMFEVKTDNDGTLAT